MNRARVLTLAASVAALILFAVALRPSPAGAERELADFAITVEQTEEGLRLTCSRGCAWTELAWSADSAQAIDEYGMAADPEERAALAGELIQSLETVVDPDVEAAWSLEIRARLDRLAEGSATTIPWAEARRRIHAAAGRASRS
jgi:hypothetical protein